MTIPEGWQIDRHDNGVIVVQKSGECGYAASVDVNNIASTTLHALARDMLAAVPVSPAGGKVEVQRWHPQKTPIGTIMKPHAEGDFVCLDEHHAYVTRLQAVNAALQARLTVADQRIDDLEKDKRRLDALESEGWEIRHHSAPLADTGDYTTSIEIVGRWMDKPHERVIGENYNENLRAAIDQAMTADAYPPARPEYPEIDAALSDDDWQMNPCKQGHRDVGACGGQAFCHTCDETIIAATTLEAFEQWNATHPANPQ